MSRDKEEGDVEKGIENSKAVSNKADDRNKSQKKHEKRHNSESKDEATSSNHSSSHKTSRKFSNTHGNRNPPKKNIAQNRLKKLRTKLDAEIKLKDKIESVGISRLLDESVVKVEKSSALPNNHKLPKILRTDNRNSSGTRNVASERLKKVKNEMQAVVKSIERSGPILELISLTSKPQVELILPTSKPHLKPASPILEPVEDRESFMEIDESFSESDEKVSNQKYILSKTEKISVSHGPSLSNNNDMNFSDVTYKIKSHQNIKEPSIGQSVNVSDNDSHFDVIPFINDEIYKIREEPSYMALHTNFLLDIGMEIDTPDGDLLVVIDTNVFLSHLNIVSYLLTNSSIPSLSSCVLVVPWPVIQEIDYAMKKSNERLNSQARFANNFINDCLKKKNPRFFAQSLVDFKDNFKNAVNVDDFILQYCMKFVSFNKKVILLTNDKNLSNKAMINNLTVFSTKEFVNSFDLSKFF